MIMMVVVVVVVVIVVVVVVVVVVLLLVVVSVAFLLCYQCWVNSFMILNVFYCPTSDGA